MSLEEAERLGWDVRYLSAVRAKRRFRAIVRLVLHNISWISATIDIGLVDNVMKNVEAIKRKKKSVHLLKPQDLALLNKPHEYRTAEERKHLNSLFGKLSFFRKYPEHVKEQLARKAYFRCYGPNRVIIRQGDEPRCMYFLLSGEVGVYKTSMDPVLKKIVQDEVALIQAGTVFGDVAILHHIARTATCTTKSICEMICLDKDDFNMVLRHTIMTLWNHIEDSMARFTYFDKWDHVSKRECCIAAKTRDYKRYEVILGDGVGLPGYTYFVLKGKCRVIEQILMECEIRQGRKYYKLYEPPQQTSTRMGSSRDSQTEVEVKVHDPQSETPLNILKSPKASLEWAPSKDLPTKYLPDEISSHLATLTIVNPNNRKKETTTSIISSAHTTMVKSETKLPKNVETRFMQVCYYRELACFNVGENMRHRRIIAMGDVECMLIPRFWLMEHNQDNTWTKIQQFLDLHTPSTKQIFSEYFRDLRWQRYKKKLVDDIISKRRCPVVNTIYNVPYSIRINAPDLNDFDEPTRGMRSKQHTFNKKTFMRNVPFLGQLVSMMKKDFKPTTNTAVY